MFRRKSVEPTLPPEWIIAGLGNPGPEYSGTRHNVGFDCVDRLAEKSGIVLKIRKHRGVYGVGQLCDLPVVLLKPMTFMNLSGQCIKILLHEYGLKASQLIVITDDLDLPVGKVRARMKGGAGGHNGHRSIAQSLGTQDYPRIRIGIDKSDDETVSHVLSRFRPEERVDIEQAFRKIYAGFEAMGSSGLDRAIEAWNQS
ncbi:MAG TPA: aminoacyl-tRNA hydrolase [Fimbriimonadaceae bacterium]|nr:aminoacyl-tRNA hydrolase [Fimbriimonadaceae bacterium]HRJ32799.1 aminoacyl-tRNA hydrolase [Fimbriimonadaceae bacterium]